MTKEHTPRFSIKYPKYWSPVVINTIFISIPQKTEDKGIGVKNLFFTLLPLVAFKLYYKENDYNVINRWNVQKGLSIMVSKIC